MFLEIEQKVPVASRFPFRTTDVSEAINHYLVLPHWHDHLEVIKVTNGKVSVQTDETTFIAAEGDLLFFNSRQIHAISLINGEKAAIRGIIFDRLLLDRSLSNQHTKQMISALLTFKQINNHYPPSHEQWAKLNDRFEEIITESNSKKMGYEFIVISEIYRFMSILLRLHAHQIGSTYTPNHREQPVHSLRKLKPALEYIESHYANRLNLREISHHVDMSPYHFSREFKKVFGRTPMQMVSEVRINHAKLLLLNWDIQITEIAAKVGFYDIAHFSKAFKQETGHSPLQFRNKFKPENP